MPEISQYQARPNVFKSLPAAHVLQFTAYLSTAC